jgi:hypothetical protein
VTDGGDPWNGWKPLLDELERRKTRAREMGGPSASHACFTSAASSTRASASHSYSIRARSSRSVR